MPGTILTQASGGAADTAIFTTALAAARQCDGHLIALHVRPDVQREIATLAAADMGVTPGLDSVMARMEEDADAREKAAAAAWQAFAKANGVTPADAPGPAGVTGEFQTETGTDTDWLAEYGRAVDLIVLGRGREDGIVAMDVLEAALMETGRPILIAPDNPLARFEGPVAIAWKNTREAARAASAAMPFILAARRAIIFMVEEDGSDAGDPSALRLARSLRWHGADVEVRRLSRSGDSAIDTLLTAVAGAHCSLLAMGGYGHTRLREAVFGGFTRAVLERAPLPVLMAH